MIGETGKLLSYSKLAEQIIHVRLNITSSGIWTRGIYSLEKFPPPLTWNDKRCAKLNRGEKNYISGKQIEKREKLPLSIQYFSPISKSYNFFLKLST